MMGKLIWLMGPSGSGKDSLLAELRLREQTQLLVAHRYITRDASAGSENHIALSEQEFFTRAVGWHATALPWVLLIHCVLGKKQVVRGASAAGSGRRGKWPDRAARKYTGVTRLVTNQIALKNWRLCADRHALLCLSDAGFGKLSSRFQDGIRDRADVRVDSFQVADQIDVQ